MLKEHKLEDKKSKKKWLFKKLKNAKIQKRFESRRKLNKVVGYCIILTKTLI